MRSGMGLHTPYPGLRPFREDESSLFFGRERQTDELIDRLRLHHFVAVTGPSGCGKSSLIGAGVIPALLGGFMGENGGRWRVARMRPGDSPIRALATALAVPEIVGDAAEDTAGPGYIQAALRLGPLGLAQIIRESPPLGEASLFLLVDQFEEIFRFREHIDADEADAFVRLLLETVTQPDLRAYIAITMRSDYLGHCTVFNGLPEAINDAQYLTPRLTRDECGMAIRGPARVCGGDVDAALINRLLNDFGRDPDQLPLLQHALMRMWTRRTAPIAAVGGGNVVLGVADYTERLGNMLDNHVEDVYGELKPEQQLLAQVLFRRLTERGRGRLDTRAPASLGEVRDIARCRFDELEPVVEAFRREGCNFIVAADRPLRETSLLDIGHESLIRQWKRLSAWVDEEAESAAIYLRLVDMAEWHAAGNADLLRDPQLQSTVDWRNRNHPNEAWASRYHPGFQVAVRFLNDSIALREAEKRGFDPELARRLQSLGYEIDQQISQSDFRILYRAKRLTDDRPVAVKTLTVNKRVADRDFLLREAEVTKRLDHEGVVSVLEVHPQSSPPFFITEWVDGQPIDQALEGADWHTKAKALEAVCHVIEHAHRQGIVHGGLRPSKILMRPDGRPKVLDFGTDRLLDDGADPSGGGSAGAREAALYMAPDQVRGEKSRPGADAYALGAILYRLLTGKSPFAAGNLHDIRNAHLHQAPDLPILICEKVPEQLQRICLKALEKSDADRYPSVRQLREDLQRYRHGNPVLVRPTFYNNLIENPAKDHVERIEEWYRNSLITESEYVRLRRAYETLTQSGLKAISESRRVHQSVLTLYLGAWLFLAGSAIWLTLSYKHLLHSGVQESGMFRVALGVLPVLLTNWLWLFFTRRGSYRFAFAAMVVGLISLPFAVGVALHEAATLPGLKFLGRTVTLGDSGQQLLDPQMRHIQVALALLIALSWDTYVAIKSRTLTSATIAGMHFLCLYLVVLDFWGLNYLFDFDNGRAGDGMLWMLLAAGTLGLTGAIVAKKSERRGQAKPLFAIAIVLAIVASQGVAMAGPKTWGWPPDRPALFEIFLGIVYLGSSIFLRDRFRVEGAAAYIALARLAPVVFLAGFGFLDYGWHEMVKGQHMPPFLIKNLTPWAPVLLVASIAVVFLAAKLQSPFYSVLGLACLAYAVSSIALEIEVKNWLWPVLVMVTGLSLTAWLTWWDVRQRVGQDIDDVGEELIRRSRKRSSTAEIGPDLKRAEQ